MIPFITKLDHFLTRHMREKTSKVSQPKYLYNASIDFPDTAVKSILDETIHIYQNSLEIIVHALNFTMRNLRSDENLETIAKKQTKIQPFNVDKAYNSNVKSIYSQVIMFIARANFTWREEQSASLHWLRDANQNLAKSIKAVKHLQKNLDKYIISDNEFIRHEYNQMRVDIMDLLRKLEDCRHHCDDDDTGTRILALDAYKLLVEENEQELSNRLFKLIQEESITPLMGTSLMNDGAYTARISRNLLEMASTIFITGNLEETKAERALVLDDEDIAEVLDKEENHEVTHNTDTKAAKE
jgi:phosphate:Na+ symporter